MPTRLLVLCGLCCILAGFWFGPDLLGLDTLGRSYWAVPLQIGGDLGAAVLCALAAQRSKGGDRAAWINFAIGSALHAVGSLFYLFDGFAGIERAFPGTPEAAHFLMAGFFVAGMLQYGNIMQQVGTGRIYTFVLTYCAVTLSSLLLLNASMAASALPPWGTIVAFLYPTLWFGVAASALISMLLYDQGRKSFALLLLLLAVLAEAIGDLGYARELMSGTHPIGGVIQLLWLASAALIGFAALEQMALSRRRGAEVMTRASERSLAHAALPATAIAITVLSASLSGAFGVGWLAGLLAMLFAAVTGFREHWMIRQQRALREAIELSRTDLAKSQQRLSAVLESTSDSVLVLDRDWNVVYFNKHAVETINLGDLLRLGISIWELFPAALTSGEGAQYRRAVETGRPAEFEIFVEDRKAWLGIHAYPTQDGLSIFFRDISEQKLVRDQIAHLAHHDALTGLANRLTFQTALKDAVESAAPVAVLLLDLDHFKEVNDTLGHPVGDAVLGVIAERLRHCTRPTDTIARLGGDEFAIILAGDPGTAGVLRVTQAILTAAGEPVAVEGQSVRVGASVGIALSDGATDPDQVFKNADIALYAAKAESRGGFRFFEPAMEERLQQRQMLRAELAEALGNGQFELAYQPLVDLASDRICGFEALLRWNHPTQGIFTPETFLPVAEESGLIFAIGDWVLRTACAEATTWPAGVTLAVNLSTKQFANAELADRVEAALLQSGLPRERLELEITESVLLADGRANMATLQQLRDRGIRIALDDFGTGYSSLGYLQRFPFSKIKIDRSFISGLPANEESQAIVRSVIGLGRSLGMRVTAEGVETQDQLAWVKAGCDEAQGHLLSLPMPASEIPSILARMGAATIAANTGQPQLAS